MNKFEVNYNQLENSLTTNPRVFRLEDVKGKIRKVAFDVVKFHETEGLDGLWKIEKNEEGEYIVANYENESLTAESSAEETHWKAIASDDTVHIFYKKTPVTKVSMASFGVSEEESDVFISTLAESLSKSAKLRTSLMKEINVQEREELFSKYPELQG